MISTQIFWLRTQNNMSQAQLAKELHISPSTLGMYEQGRRVPSLDILLQLSNYFHVSLDFLVTGADFPHTFPSQRTRSPENCPCHTCYWKARQE